MTELVSILGVISMFPTEGEEGPTGIMGSPFFLLIIIFALFYFILYMPEKKRRQQREQMLKGLERGDEVITAGGIYGKITALTDKVATVEIAPNTRIRVSRSQVSKVTADEAKGKGKGEDKEEKKKK